MSGLVEMVLVPPTRDLDGFPVRRALPSPRRRMVGPFVFVDHIGPGRLPAGGGLDVRPHPHIGLATVTYLFEGELMHRDSLGSVQRIRPGEVNWMTAGRGIVHSERTPDELRAAGPVLSGVQVWVALPLAHEECEPTFHHHDADEIPVVVEPGSRLAVVIGTLHGVRSPVVAQSEMLYAHLTLADGTPFHLPPVVEERGVYVLDGAVLLADGTRVAAGELAVLSVGADVVLRAEGAVSLMILGGETVGGHRHVWWNFVSSSRERIERAARDWEAGRFAAVPGETEFIPLPDGGPGLVRYP